MAKRVGMEVSIAVAETVGLCDADVVAAYPITPQTHIVEHLAEMVANGELDAEFIPVESEHSAMSACIGSAAAGARTFTATAGQGLELMHEVLYAASGMQLPIVMAVANRALSAPLSVSGDHSDVMAVRDTGWIQIFAENGQEAVDQTICAFRIAEDRRVLLPVMVHLDGFYLTHMIEPVLLPDEEEVKRFLPLNDYPLPLWPEKPVAMGGFALPIVYSETKKAQEVNLEASKKVILEHWENFRKQFGRQYRPVECYNCGDTDTYLVTMGSFTETAMTAVDELKKKGKNIGIVHLRLWRPYPFDDVREALREAKTVVVLDRAISFGMGGPVCAEIKNALYGMPKQPKVSGFVGGLGGRDINVPGFIEIINRGIEAAGRTGQEFEFFGVRE
jgi:pyruvate ferredoxin oxidoreductase alpha subunit